MENKLVDVVIPMPWGTISGKTFGVCTASPVLCVHGRNDNLESFSPLMPMLPLNYYYVFIDLPGHGKSNHADKGYILDLQWYAMCVKRVIMYFKWSKCVYLGHSLGGTVGFLLAAIYPDLFLKLIIIDTLMLRHVPPSGGGSMLRKYVFEPLFTLENKLNSTNAPTYSFDEFVKKMKDSRNTVVIDKYINKMAVRNLKQVGLNQYIFTNDQRNKFSGNVYYTNNQSISLANEITCPTLVILGNSSAVTYPNKMLSFSPLNHIKNITFHTIEGDHDVHMNHPEQVVQLIIPFLSQGRESKL